MAINIKIVIPTKQSKEQFEKSQCFINLSSIIINNSFNKKLDINFTLKPILENTKGLSDLYQDELNVKDSDYMVFMHDDLEIHDHFFVEKLIKSHEYYDVVGLAGAVYQDYNKHSTMAWHLCMDDPKNARGIVNHYIPQGFNGCSQSYINSVFFGPTPSPVVVMDGLFMSFKMKSLQDNLDVFDRQFTFHHYDMGMCCKAYDNGLKMGVWPIFVIHHGLGEFANDKLWQKHAEEFKQKHKNKILKI